MTGLFTEDGKLTHKNLRKARTRPAYNSQPIYGLGTIDADASSAWFYGLAKGTQYSGMSGGARDTVEDAAQSDCFYSVYGLVDTADLLVYDLKTVATEAQTTGQVKWFNVAAYDPIHMTGDTMVTYQ